MATFQQKHKEAYIKILETLKEEIPYWDWDEDYFDSGLGDNYDAQLEWSNNRIDELINFIKGVK